MISALTGEARWLHAMAAAAFLAASVPNVALLAQGLEDSEAVDTIIGSDVSLEETRAEDEVENVVAALENTAESTSQVRMSFALDNVEIVVLPGIEEAALRIASALQERADEIADLHGAIEGNAMFYHAVNSREIVIQDIVALEFDDANGVKIYTAGEAPAE